MHATSTYNEMSSVVTLALCITMSSPESLPLARSTMKGMKTNMSGTAAIQIVEIICISCESMMLLQNAYSNI